MSIFVFSSKGRARTDENQSVWNIVVAEMNHAGPNPVPDQLLRSVQDASLLNGYHDTRSIESQNTMAAEMRGDCCKRCIPWPVSVSLYLETRSQHGNRNKKVRTDWKDKANPARQDTKAGTCRRQPEHYSMTSPR